MYMPRTKQEKTTSATTTTDLNARLEKFAEIEKHDKNQALLKHLISMQTVGVFLARLPADMRNDETIYNAMLRAHHVHVWREPWNENLTGLVKEYFTIVSLVLDQVSK